MEFYGDYHTHTKYSDGFTSVYDNLLAAKEQGLKEIGITDHGYASPSLWSLTRKKYIKQKKEIDSFRDEFSQLKIYVGIEANIIGSGGEIDLKEKDYETVDYIVAGFHSPAKPFNWTSFKELYMNSYKVGLGGKATEDAIKRNTHTYVSMLKKYPIAILAHVQHLTKVDILEVAKACADYGTYLELNGKHIVDLSNDDIEKILSTEVKLIANSDGHYKDKIANFSSIIEHLKNYPEIWSRVVNVQQSAPVFKKPI